MSYGIVDLFLIAVLYLDDRMWTMPEVKESDIIRTNSASVPNKELIAERYFSQMMDQKEEARTILGEGSSTVDDLQLINKAVSNLEMELAAARTTQESILRGYPIRQEVKVIKTIRHKYFMVIGINTAFNSRKRRDSIRATWMPQGDKRKKLEEEKGIVICFVIGHGATSGGILNRAIDAEEKKHGDFLRLDHVEGYLELSAKTKSYFATAFSLWDAEFYVKVDDDVHVNIGKFALNNL
ncbi:hypothetical protein ZIOFF_043043 [Zingiber officinale]|uniref:Hexosyltransferase n=1 Tax=Zingiber officinale TaxID=94328 RepID=A0A8J5KTS9_ZINOF|nr:hypothetical protein ZIOFF_043043 [Zingiber officinale]